MDLDKIHDEIEALRRANKIKEESIDEFFSSSLGR